MLRFGDSFLLLCGKFEQGWPMVAKLSLISKAYGDIHTLILKGGAVVDAELCGWVEVLQQALKGFLCLGAVRRAAFMQLPQQGVELLWQVVCILCVFIQPGANQFGYRLLKA